MDKAWRTMIWRQYGGAIDMLEDAMRACPDDLWNDPSRPPEVWRIVYHTLFWLDFYLSDSVEGFAPPEPFGLEELDPAGVPPSRLYTKEELFAYLEYGREKCRKAILGMSEETAHQPAGSKRPELTNVELLLYNMRHVQHGAAQVNLILRQAADTAGRWVGFTRRSLEDK